MFQHIFQRVGKLVKAYGRNIFNGKITTLIGVVIVFIAIRQMLRPEADYISLTALLLTGLGLLGVKDPSSASSDK